MIALGLLVSIINGQPPQTVPDSDGIVAVYAQLSSDSSAQGTGFFVSPSGDVITCYHVIRRARRLTVWYDGQEYSNVLVKAISPESDLALLSLAAPVPRHRYHRLAPEGIVGSTTEQLKVVGWPRGAEKSVLYGNLTQSTLGNSLSLVSPVGPRVFARQLQLVILDVSTYGGMSGAPVISKNGVIGVLSGSYAEGRGIAWAIPTRYATTLRNNQIGRDPRTISDWPAFDLMTEDAGWNGLRGLYRRNEAAAGLFGDFERRLAFAESLYVDFRDDVNTILLPVLAEQATDDSLLAILVGSAEANPSRESELVRFIAGAYFDNRQRIRKDSARLNRNPGQLRALLDSANMDAAQLVGYVKQLRQGSDRKPRVDSVYQSIRLRDEAFLAQAERVDSAMSTLGGMHDRYGAEYDRLWFRIYREIRRSNRVDHSTLRDFLIASHQLTLVDKLLLETAAGPVFLHMLQEIFGYLRELREAIVFESRPNYSGSYE